MSAALNNVQRTALSVLIQKARTILEGDLASTLEGHFGIHRRDGRLEEPEALSLNARHAAVRVDLLDIVSFLRGEGEAAPASVDRLIREAAFTHVNRLVALRVAEGLGILPEAIGNGLASQGFRDFAEIAPASADEDWERFRLFVRICADELSADVPALFDPRNPLLELEPSTAAFAELIALLVGADITIWSAPDALGWSYQFFNSGDERKEMRESSAPRNSRELAVRNQFFTPSYVVEFLVQNGLGAHLASSFPALADEMPLLVEVPETSDSPIDLRSVSVLDPACGSGHFLLGAYDVVEAAWRHAGVVPGDAAPDILRSLWGIDIDPRATQIAQAAVIFRARRHCRTPLPKPNVICARSLPTGPDTDALIADLPVHVGRVVRAIADELVAAPMLGPLLKIEERLDREARDAFGTGQIEGTLSEGMADAEANNIESLVLDALSTIADQTTSSASQRLFAAEAHDAVRFVEAMSLRYTACLMNPPFGEPVETTKEYIKAQYPEVPRGAYLEATFVDRALALLDVGGSVGVVSSRSPLFLSTFTHWRVSRLLDGRLRALLDVGHGLMEQALVEAAAMVLHGRPSSRPLEAISLLRSQDRELDLTLATSGRLPDSVDWYRTDVRPLLQLPTKPLCYWASAAQLAVWSKWDGLEETWCDVRVGSWPGDDFRHLRLWWESGHPTAPKEWVPYAKGGPYAPYFEEPHLVVDWDSDRGTFWEFFGRKGRPTSIPENRDYYRRPGLTWSRRTASGLSVRVLPSGSIFADKGPAMFAANDDRLTLLSALAWLNSRPAKALLDLQLAAGEETSSGSASRSYEVGLLRALPVPDLSVEQRREVAELCDSILALLVAERSQEETSRLFDSSRWVPKSSLRELVFAQYQGFLDSLEGLYACVGAIESVFEQVLPSETNWVDSTCGKSVWRFPVVPGRGAEISALFGLTEDALVDLALSSLGGARYLAVQSHHVNRRVELLCYLHRSSPLGILMALRHDNPPAWFDAAVSRDLISYCVGRSFRRWGELGPGSEDGFREIEMSAALDGPLVLVDEALCNSARHEYVSMGFGSDVLDDAAALVDRGRGLASYVSGRFFADHLGRYSMSRRKAPIYWQLQVPSRAWGVWLYMPRLSRETLFAVVRETEQRQRLAEQRIATLQREYDSGGAGKTIAAVSKELDAEQKLAVELVAFRDESERIANLGWEPDLDDGAVLNAAPLASLFPAWKEAAAYRKELRQGKHSWSTVSRFADQL